VLLAERRYRNKPRIGEPRNYRVQNAAIKLLTWQTDGVSSGPGSRRAIRKLAIAEWLFVSWPGWKRRAVPIE
jgi:hypothetical protein